MVEVQAPPQARIDQSEYTGFLSQGAPVYLFAGGLYTFRYLATMGKPLAPGEYWRIMWALLEDEEFLAKTRQL